MGIAISSKIAKAVKRNYIKRLIRESYRSIEEEISTENRIVILWKKKKDVKEASFSGIKEDIRIIFDKAKLFRG